MNTELEVALRKADELEQKALEDRAKAARGLVATFSRRDAGVLLNLSHQRIQQLVATTAKKKGTRTRKVA